MSLASVSLAGIELTEHPEIDRVVLALSAERVTPLAVIVGAMITDVKQVRTIMSDISETVLGATSAEQGEPRTHMRKHQGNEYPVSLAHPIANLFPWASEEEVDAMVAEISDPAVRQKTPIDRLPDGRIVDGRTQELACRVAGVDPKYEEVNLDDEGVEALVKARNLTRRHMSESQRAIAATGLPKLGRGRPRNNPSQDGFTQADAATEWGVSTSSIERARKVREKGIPALAELVRDNRLDVRPASELAKLSVEVQQEIAFSPDPRSAASKKLKSLAKARASKNTESPAVADPAPVEHVSGPNPDDPAVEAHPPQAHASEDVSPAPSAEPAPDEHSASPAPEGPPVETSSPSQDEATEDRSEVSDDSSTRPAMTPEQVQVEKLAAHISEFGPLIDMSLDSAGLIRTALKNVVRQKADKVVKRLSDGHTRVEKNIRAFLIGKVDEEARYQQCDGLSNAVGQYQLDWPVLKFIEGVIQELPAEIAKINAGVRGKT